MAATGVSSVKPEKSSRSFRESLSSAFYEWMLMFLLFINALFSYLTTKFARYCDLQTPCLLCSRLDHILGKERLGFYWDMICSHHKSEISSLVLCHAHRKLVDVHGICENCLFSFATINKSNTETYRLLVGKLGGDSDSGSFEDEFSPEGHRISKLSMNVCSCCNEPWISKGPTQTLIETTSIMSQLVELDVPLSGVIGALKSIGDGSSKRTTNREISDMSHVGYMELKIASDTESEVPFSDDDETNVLLSKRAGLIENYWAEPPKVDPLIRSSYDDSAVKLEERDSVEQISASLPVTKIDATEINGLAVNQAGVRENSWLEPSKVDQLIMVSSGDSAVKVEEQCSVEHTSAPLPETKVDDATENIVLVPEQGTMRETSWVEPPEVDPLIKVSSGDSVVKVEEKSSVDQTSASLPKTEVDTTEINSPDLVEPPKVDPLIKEQSSVEEASASLIETEVDASDGQEDEPVGTVVGHGLDEINWQNSENKDKDAPGLIPELISFDDLPTELTNGAIFKELSPETTLTETNEAQEKDSDETSKVETEPITAAEKPAEANIVSEKPAEANFVSSDLSPRMPNLLDLGDAYKLAVGNRGRQLSGALTEQWLAKDISSRVSEDLKNLFSQLSAPRASDQSPAPDLSPKVSLSEEDSSKALDSLQKRISLERNESNLSQDGSMVSEIEGESTMDRLKRQVDHDRRVLSALYKELEEERNASAISANQAMAMITRLQEEKATLQMEALQYLRMMEEQAEYDMEALQKSNDLLAEREKDIQDLEEELEFYRGHLAESMDIGRTKDSVVGIENERLHILESLKKLEEKLGLYTGEGAMSESVDCESHCSGKEEAKDVSSGSPERETSPNNGMNKDEEIDLASVKNEVVYLQQRLEALEADRNFLEQTVKHLRIGEEGLRFVRDIAFRLQEIRSAEPKSDHQASC